MSLRVGDKTIFFVFLYVRVRKVVVWVAENNKKFFKNLLQRTARCIGCAKNFRKKREKYCVNRMSIPEVSLALFSAPTNLYSI